MSFIKFYIFWGIWSMTILTTFSLSSLFNELYEKIGLIFLWLVLIFSTVFKVNKLDLLWLTPLAFIIPYYFYKITKTSTDSRFKYLLRYMMSIFF